MVFRIFFMVLVGSSCDVLLSEGSVVNQTNSTQNYTAVVTPSNSQIISPSTESSQLTTLPTPSSSPSSSSLVATFTSAITPTSMTSITSSSISQDTFQIDAEQGSSSENQAKYVILPPEQQRRDFNLIANTKLHWVRYLLDQSGPEFSALKQHVEEYLYKTFKDVPGFVKTEVTEFEEKKFTFYAKIYTRKSAKVSGNEFQAALAKVMFSKETNELEMYAFAVSPRFTEMPRETRVASLAPPPKADASETVNGSINFLKGFGAMFAFAVVFATIGFIKYKVCKSFNKQDDDQKTSLHEVHDQEVTD